MYIDKGCLNNTRYCTCLYTCNIAAESSFALLYAPDKGSTLSHTIANSCTVVMKLQLHIYTCMYMYTCTCIFVVIFQDV